MLDEEEGEGAFLEVTESCSEGSGSIVDYQRVCVLKWNALFL